MKFNLFNEDRVNFYQFFIVLLIGAFFAALLFTFISDEKRGMMLTLGLLIGVPLFIGAGNKEKLLIAMVIFFLPLNPELHIIRPPNPDELRYITGANRIILYFTDLPLILLLALLLIKKSTEKFKSNVSIWRNDLLIPLMLWMGMGVLSLLPADMPRLTIFELIRMGRMIITFIIFMHYVKGPDDVRFIIRCFLLSILFQSVLMFVQFVTNSLIISPTGLNKTMDIATGIFRPQGTLPHSSHFAKWSGVLLPISICFGVFAKHSIDKALGFASFFCGVIALFLTVSRAGLLALLFSLILIAGYFIHRGMLSFRKVVLAVFISSLLFIPVGLTLGQRVLDRIMHDELSAWSRFPMYTIAANVIKANPILGVGLSNYTLVAPDYDNTPSQISKWYPWPVHNLYLFYAAEIGMIGLLFFLWFFWKLVSNSINCAKFPNTLLDKAIYFGIAFGILNLLIQNLIGWGFRAHMIHMSTIALLAACVGSEKLRLDWNFKESNG